MTRPIRVLLADDHALVRAGLRRLLEEMPDVEVVGEVGTGREVLQKLETMRPDVVLMDIMMPELNGLDAAARVAAANPQIRVLILSMNATEEYVLQALRAGAAGYLLKNISPAELEQAVRTVARGDIYVTPSLTKYMISGLLQRAGTEPGSLARLTTRQREVLQLVAEGNTTKEIARKLGVSVKTAETHRTQLMAALDIHDVAGLTRYAIRMGVIQPQD